MKKSIGFTLAETLITLGIIGVVAMLTIPPMISNYQEKVRVTQLNATYNLLHQAVDRMIEDEQKEVLYWGSNGDERAKRFEELLPKYVHIVKTCKGYKTGCIGKTYSTYKTSDVVAGAGITTLSNSYVLNNGAGIKVSPGGYCVQDVSLSKIGLGSTLPQAAQINYGSYCTGCVGIMVDINGEKGPNKLGIDAFSFYLYLDGIGPAGGPKETIWTETFNDQCLLKKQYGMASAYCAAWVIYNKNMDYLHCPDKLGWNKALSCK